ncbi:MAG: YggS family pyridoxal phosphate-dependent enzyme [Lutibacter sp.]|jgi:hypothetical protein|nr:YggS family pyridoxal phosphate-dependent enzyme [Lutibacter sp.]
MSIAENLLRVQKTLPKGVALIAVSKTQPVSNILAAYQAGQRVFGENKVQEMADKYDLLPKDIEWHMIGHLQRNKVKYMAPFVSLIHGVDSLKTLQEIDKQAKRYRRTIDCLLQVKIASESTKFGLSATAVKEILESETCQSLANIRIRGLMGMASFTADESVVKAEFTCLEQLFKRLQKEQITNSYFDRLSMGMSGDYTTAITAGSNMVRIGSAIFGPRNYP